jgi:hypothetical protein
MYKNLFEKQETMFICRYTMVDMLHIPNTEPDPGQPNECGSMRIRIHNNTATKAFHADEINTTSRIFFLRDKHNFTDFFLTRLTQLQGIFFLYLCYLSFSGLVSTVPGNNASLLTLCRLRRGGFARISHFLLFLSL